MKKPIKKFLFRDFIKNKELFHLARVQIHSRHDLSLHTHDFAEIFWIESGKGYHLINGKKKNLYPGDLIMIRPTDTHTFTATAKNDFILMNLAFGLETLKFLEERYFKNTNSFFWHNGVLPYHINLRMDLIKRISQKAKESIEYKSEVLHLDEILLFIFRIIKSSEKIKTDLSMPEWLIKGISNYNSPNYFGMGAAGFANLCNRNIDHVNRVVKSNLNKTLSDLITELRLSFASRQLIITSTPIKTIALESGYTNISHFYQVFKEHYKQTPSQFRKMNQTIC
ncbi:MAG: AraC family transcriptional regulator [Bacteroidota bacterium]